MYSVLSLIIVFSVVLINLIAGNTFSQILMVSMLLILMTEAMGNFYLRKKIRIKMLPIKGVEVGKNAKCCIVVRNDGKIPAVMAHTTIEITNMYSGQKKQKQMIFFVPPQKSVSAECDIANDHSGKIQCKINKFYLTDILGLIKIKAESKAHSNYTVIPQIFDTFIDYTMNETDIYDCETYSEERKGKDQSEVFQIREYVEGDSIKHIHWKLSSKLDSIVVKDPALPIDKDLMVFWDKSIESASLSDEQKEAAAEMALSICQSLLEEGMAFNFVAHNTEQSLCTQKEIQYQDTLAELIQQMLETGHREGIASLAEIYDREVGECKATHVIYISNYEDADVDNYFAKAKLVKLNASRKDYKEAYGIINLQ